jgi:hypothetical protein
MGRDAFEAAARSGGARRRGMGDAILVTLGNKLPSQA